MKKFLSIIICLTLVLSTLLLVGCKKNETLKLGLGVTTTVSTADATEDKNGNGKATITAAAVLVDDEGKIVKAFIDCAESTVEFDASGKAIANKSFQTKYEKGKNYGMTNPAYGGTATKEWYEQADAFCSVIVGKTASEVKALVVADTAKGTEEVINAGCTIYVSDFATAIDKAIANATASEATAEDSIKLGVSTSQSTSDANEDKGGYNQVETTFFAAAVNAEGKVVASSTDCVQVKFTFDNKGASTLDTKKAISSKKEAGVNYGMTNPAYGGTATKEWFEQAAAFDAACKGKTVSEIKALQAEDGKGVADLQSAGCTIYVSEFVKAASKVG